MSSDTRLFSVDDVEISSVALAGMLGLTERRVQQLVDEGVMVRVRRGWYSLDVSIAGYLKFLRDQVPGKNEGDRGEQTLLTRARRVSQEMDNSVKRGELTVRSDEDREAVRQARDTRLALEAIPDRIASEVAAEPDEVKVHTLMSDEIRQVLNALYKIELERQASFERLESEAQSADGVEG